jgi:hypothetical protein
MSDRLAIVQEFDEAEPAEPPALPATLDIPIDVNFQKRQFSVLSLREPKAKEMERAERELNVGSPTPWHFRKYQMALIAAVAKVPIEVVGELANSQVVEAWGFLERTLKPIPPTGEN